MSQQQINAKVDVAADMLKELETVESNMIQTIYEYNKLNRAQLQQTMKQVTQEHRSGQIDPASSAASKVIGRRKPKKKRGYEPTV